MPPPTLHGREQDRYVLALVAAGSLVAGAGLYWAVKSAIDYYVPYRVRGQPMELHEGSAAHTSTLSPVPVRLAVSLSPWNVQWMAGKRSEHVLQAAEE